jgi:hypothetical protein
MVDMAGWLIWLDGWYGWMVDMAGWLDGWMVDMVGWLIWLKLLANG